MRGVMLSIRPRWVELIAAKAKTVEVRKTAPKDIKTPFKCYIYQTREKWSCSVLRKLRLEELADRLESATGKVVGEFVCDICTEFTQDYYELSLVSDGSCVPQNELKAYLGAANKKGWVWHISELKIYEKPKPLSDFFKQCVRDKWPFCKDCTYGVQGDEAKALLPGTRYFDVPCGNWMKNPPVSWCYVEAGDGA